jgi:hypothetical protein
MEALRKTVSASEVMRTRIITGLAATVSTIWVLTIMLPDNLILSTPLSQTITSGIAAAAATVVATRQKTNGLYGSTYVALAAGLACWFAGQVIWTYDNMIVGKEPTQLLLADIPWLTLYAFFGYYVFKTYQFFGHAVNQYHIITVVSAIAMVIAYTTYAMLDSLEQIESPAVAAVRLLYPFGDAVLIIPSVLLLITLRHGLLTYTPWLFISVALILIAAADIFFTNISALGAFDLIPIAYPLYNAGNLAFVGALLWYNKFGIYDQSSATSSFQERNR